MPNESKHIEFQKKLVSQLNGALNNFICSVHKGFTKEPNEFNNNICIYGLNISIYLKIGNTNKYRIYSLYYTQETNSYYDGLWKEYLVKYDKKFSKFDDEETKFNGWFDNCTFLEKYKKRSVIIPYKKNMAEFVGVISDSSIRPNNDENFIHVNEGWIKFLEEKSKGKNIPFNLQWTASFLHESKTVLEYPEWYVSCYLLADIDENFNDGKYKQTVRPAVNKLLFSSSLAFHELLIDEKQQDIQRQATRAAISQVLARNMSHNIGSHVLSRLDSEKIKKIYEACSIGKPWMDFYTPLDIDNNKKHTGLDLLGIFNSYQKSRMDFLADVTFGEPTLEITKDFYSEVLNNIDQNYILMDSISGTDYKYKIVARNLTSDEVKVHFGKPCSDNCAYIIGCNGVADVAVSIPNDILGCHAFYLILENLIRNCAKHGGTGSGDQKIHIDIADSDLDGYYQVLIYDSAIKDFADKDKNLILDQNTKINENVLGEDGKLRQGGWGLMEMEVGAAYLRKLPIENISEEEFDIDIENSDNFYPLGKNDGQPNLLKALQVGDHLGYRLFLMKPKEVLIINENKSEKKDFKKHGIVTKSVSEIDTVKQSYPYPILLFRGTSKDFQGKIINSNSAVRLPNRILICFTDEEDIKSYVDRFTHEISKEEFDFVNEIDNPLEFKNHIWALWLKKNVDFLKLKFSMVLLEGSSAITDIKNRLKKYGLFESFEDEVFNPIYTDHGIDSITSENLNDVEKAKGNQMLFAEPYNSKDYFILKKVLQNQDKFKNQDKAIEKKDFALYCQLLEATLSTIHIVDERIQELAESKTYRPEMKSGEKPKECQYIDILYATNVIVPPYPCEKSKSLLTCEANPNRFDLNRSDYTEEYHSIVTYLKSVIRKKEDNEFSKRKADFLLIHLGVIEKLIGANKNWENGKETEGINAFIKEVILEENTETQTKIIIVSGRGKPSNMPSEYLYLNYSIVSQYCFENRLKLYLNQVVYSSKSI
jgi:hypothetical protein